MLRQAKETFYCEPCNYRTERKSSYNKHLLTEKHRRNSNGIEACPIKLCKAEVEYKCDTCGRHYKNRSGLWKHMKNCDEMKHIVTQSAIVSTDIEKPNDHELFSKLFEYIKESERQKQREREAYEQHINAEREQCKQLMTTVQDMIPRLGNNNNNISVNVFLNERCKDALNLNDFMASLRIELNDLISSRNRGSIETVGNVFVNGLKQLDLYKRPIHCMDLKKEKLFIKENDAWNQDSEGRDKLSGALNDLAKKQTHALLEWEKRNPNWSNDEKLTAEYMDLVKISTCPIEKGSMSESKIIKTIARETQVDVGKLEEN